jgi:cytochrome c oxidase assembly protein subunit 15
MQSAATETGGRLGLPLAANSPARFRFFAWGVLAYNLAVILWGALVRATGSGAGCGGHWPLCNGDILPEISQSATVIEFTHRVMSGAALVAVVALFGWAWKVLPPRHPARRWAAWSLVFVSSEALIGAALVLLGHVARNESVGRVYSLATHLVNTFLLLACLALTAWRAADPIPAAPPQPVSRSRRWPVAIALAAVIMVAVAGAITALGDTLFPASSLAQGVADDFAATANFLIRLRVVHPLLAVLTGVYLAALAWPEYRRRRAPRLHVMSRWLLVLVATELLAGGLSVLLGAPVWMQLIHLLVADLVWITLVLFTSERLHPAG